MASSRNTMPSLAALLGLLAVAGYQNRDKLGQIFQDAKGGAQNSGGILGELGKMFGGSEEGSLSKGVGELVDAFKNGGHREAADSWVSAEERSQGISPEQVEIFDRQGYPPGSGRKDRPGLQRTAEAPFDIDPGRGGHDDPERPVA